jgi:DNA topoisomerase-3
MPMILHLKNGHKTTYRSYLSNGNSTPDEATYPDMTARWESQLSAICAGQSTYNNLMAPLNQQLEQLIETSHTFTPAGLNGLGAASFRDKGKAKRRKRNARKQTS